jgi:hypothetical protein
MLAWKVAGLIGLDYFLLPGLGTPWGGRRLEPVPVETHTGPRVIEERGSTGRRSTV